MQNVEPLDILEMNSAKVMMSTEIIKHLIAITREQSTALALQIQLLNLLNNVQELAKLEVVLILLAQLMLIAMIMIPGQKINATCQELQHHIAQTSQLFVS